jgi:uncharacterized protein YceK
VRTLLLVLLVIMILAVSAGCAAQSAATPGAGSFPSTTYDTSLDASTGATPQTSQPNGSSVGGVTPTSL